MLDATQLNLIVSASAAGPKLRKWYGASERPVDGGEEQVSFSLQIRALEA